MCPSVYDDRVDGNWLWDVGVRGSLLQNHWPDWYCWRQHPIGWNVPLLNVHPKMFLRKRNMYTKSEGLQACLPPVTYVIFIEDKIFLGLAGVAQWLSVSL